MSSTTAAQPLETLPVPSSVKRHVKKTLEMFGQEAERSAEVLPDPAAFRKKIKVFDEYKGLDRETAPIKMGGVVEGTVPAAKMLTDYGPDTGAVGILSLLPKTTSKESANAPPVPAGGHLGQLALRTPPKIPKPVWHPPWKLMRVISGHMGWVRCLAVDQSNDWFVSSGNDRLIKVWDLATGTLKLTLTGHVYTVRSLIISDRHPYMFSCGEDGQVKCWDLEYNKVVRSYHGHLSGVYCMALHPSLDVLASGGRDAVVRVWDVRTKVAAHVLSGHSGTVSSLLAQNAEPQLLSGSMDKMVRCWDLRAGKCSVVLTNHKRSVRAMALHPKEYTFASAANDSVKVWRCPNGNFERNVEGAHSIINAMAIKSSHDDSSLLVAGTDQGHMHFWDWKSGHNFQSIETIPQPGSLSSENGIFATAFDKSETRLLTGECDKTVKVWCEDDDATPETHPIVWSPKIATRRY